MYLLQLSKQNKGVAMAILSAFSGINQVGKLLKAHAYEELVIADAKLESACSMVRSAEYLNHSIIPPTPSAQLTLVSSACSGIFTCQ